MIRRLIFLLLFIPTLAFGQTVLTAIDQNQPLNISESCEFWFDGRDASTFTLDGTSVDQWDDKSGNGRHVLNGNDNATRPTYNSATGRVTFINANSTFLQSAVFGSALSQPNTIFVVYKITGGLADNEGVFDAVTNLSQLFYFHATVFKLHAGAQLVGPATNANDNIHVGEFNGLTSNYWINGDLVDAGAIGASVLDGITLGARGGLTTYADCEIMEVIGYNATLPTIDHDKITEYLSDKWDISATFTSNPSVLTDGSKVLTYYDAAAEVDTAKFYVSNSGDDTKHGNSQDSAWATTAKVSTEFDNGTFQSGDTIFFDNADTWAIDNVFEITGSSGTSGNPIVIDGSSWGAGTKATIQSNSDGGNAPKYFTLVHVVDCQYVTFQNIEFDGNNTQRFGFVIGSVSSGPTAQNAEAYITIQDCNIHDIGDGSSYEIGILVQPVNNNIDNITVQRNIVNGTSAHAISYYVTTDADLEITNSYIGYNTVTDWREFAGGEGNGIHLNNKIRTSIIEHNTLVTTTTTGKGITIERNSTDTLFFPDNFIVRYNDVTTVGEPALLLNSGGATNGDIYFNKFYSDGTEMNEQGVLHIAGIGQEYWDADLQINFNTIIAGNDTVESQRVHGMIEYSSAPNAVTFKNNIIFNNYTGANSDRGYSIRQILDGSLIHSNNVYYSPSVTDVNIIRVENTYWKRSEILANFEATAVITDPAFAIDFAGQHLQDSSGAVGAGVAVTGLTTDFEGVALSDPPNINVYETTGLNNVESFTVSSAGVGEDTNIVAVQFAEVSTNPIDPDSIRLVKILGLTAPVGKDSDSLVLASSDTSNFDGLKIKLYEDADTIFAYSLFQRKSGTTIWTKSTDTSNVIVTSPSTLLNGLVAYWKLDGSVSQARDTVNSFHGTLNGPPTQGAAGKIDNSYSFDGNDYLDCGALQEIVCTHVAWIKTHPTTRVDDDRTITGVASNGFQFRVKGNENLELLQGGVASIGTSSSGITNDTWTHVAFSYDVSGNYQFWINGVDAGSGTNLKALTFDDFFIGRRSGEYFAGLIDEVSVYDRVLTSDEITESVNGGDGTTWPFE